MIVQCVSEHRYGAGGITTGKFYNAVPHQPGFILITGNDYNKTFPYLKELFRTVDEICDNPIED